MGILSWMNGWANRRVYAFAEGIARAQLDSYRRVVAERPELDREEAYVATLAYRPGYSGRINMAQVLVDKARNAAAMGMLAFARDPSYGLREVTLELALHEYRRFMGRPFNTEDVTLIIAAIASMIPEDY